MYALKSYTLQSILFQSTKRYGSRPALSMVTGGTIRYRELEPRARRIAAFLAANGAVPGDRIAILSENRPEWGVAYFAVTSSGLVAVPILTDFIPEQIGNILEHSGAKAVLVSKKLLPKIGKGRPDLAIVDIESLEPVSGPWTRGPDSVSEDEFAYPEVEEGDLAVIIYTSGTTGHSKGVMLSNRNIVFDAVGSRFFIKLYRTDRLLSILPIAHSYECTLGFVGALMQGAAVYYLDRPPSSTVLLPALKAIRPTIMLSVPMVMEKVVRSSVLPKLEAMKLYGNRFFKRFLIRIAGMKLHRTFGGSLRFFGIGGAALSPDVEEFLGLAKFPYAIGYGLTETSPLIAGAAPFKTLLRSTGLLVPGVQARISEKNPKTGEGEIQVRGDNVMLGYYKDPEKTKECLTEDGWFRTGDLGIIDDKGMLFIRGRLKTMILGPSGENIYPEEVESVINRHDFVEESLVYGEGDGTLTALVHFKPDIAAKLRGEIHESVDFMEDKIEGILEAMKQEANSRLAAFSRISKVLIQQEPFEKTPSQKIKRFLYPKPGAESPK